MKPQKFNEQFAKCFDLGLQLSKSVEADALLVVLDGPTDWQQLKERSAGTKILVAAGHEEELAGAAEAGLQKVVVNIPGGTVSERLTQALLESVADDILVPGAEVVAVYSAFEAGMIDSISHIRLDDHLGRLTARDLRQLETSVPLDTLKAVVDLAVEIGREGREGKPVGTMFVVGDTRKVLTLCHPAGFDPVRGYARCDRDLRDPRTREAVKEIAQLEGAILITAEGIVERACQIVDASHANLTLTKGLGARHWAAAAISRVTKAISIAVSESNGTVRLFLNGEVMLRVEPLRRAMKWRDFDYEPPAAANE
ncbi:MAG: hypothetical protein FJ276_03625 [Planctomycetes bacterium]|nr:hypothetical protein [Planctomycetota bacterium]